MGHCGEGGRNGAADAKGGFYAIHLFQIFCHAANSDGLIW